MTKCRTYRQMLMQRMDKELSAGDEQRLSAHLHICPDCQALAEQLDDLSGGLRTDFSPEPPEDAEAKIMVAIRGLPPYGHKAKTFGISLNAMGLWSLAGFVVMTLIGISVSGLIGPAFPADLGRWVDSLATAANGIQLFMEIVGALFGNLLDALSRQLMFLILAGAASILILAVRSMAGTMQTWTDPPLG